MNERKSVFFEGLVLGLIGYFTIAVFFAVVNLIGGHSPFRTAAVLGQGLVGGAGEGAIDFRAVLAYNALHAAAFVAIGLAVAWLVDKAERYPQFWLVVFLLAVMGFMLTLPLFVLVAVPAAAALAWWAVVAANLLAALAMGAYLARRHPGLRRRIAAQPDATT